MPSKRPEEFNRLRRGVGRAAKWMRYSTRDTLGDAFSLFKNEVLLRARFLANPHRKRKRMPKSFVGPGTPSTCVELPCAADCFRYDMSWKQSCSQSKCKNCSQCSKIIQWPFGGG